jgi:phage terminase small subunit
MALTDKQLRFCEEYLIDLNATQAAIRAGYSEKTANEQAAQNLVKLSIQEKIKELMDARSKRTEITADKVLQEFWSIAQDDIKNYLSFYTGEGGAIKVELKDSEEIDTKNIGEISLGKDGQFKFKRYCRDNALLQVGRHLGMFKDRLDVDGNMNVNWNETKNYGK